jgi:hypothetical protein
MPRLSKRSCALALTLSLVLLGSITAVRIAIAPDVDEICEHVLALARSGGEQPGEAESAQCLEVMQSRRDVAGRVGWAKLSRCIARARSLDEAGRCKAR